METAADDIRAPEASLTFLKHSKGNIPNTPDGDKPSLLFSKRLLVIILMFLSNVNEMILRNNINIAVVDMTSQKTYFEGNLTITKKAEFDWNSKTVGILISTIPYGGFFAIFGGFVASKLGGAASRSLSMMICGVLTTLHPICLFYGVNVLIICRFLTGIIMCIYSVSAADVFSQWVPKTERSTLFAFAFSGICIGQALVNPLCGYITHLWEWAMVFYVTGSISSVLSIILFILVKNRPSQDKHISKKELSYILAGIDQTSTKKTSKPYKSILTSPPIWALTCGIFTSTWLITVILVCLPQFIKDITQKNIKDVGFISSIPNLVGIVTSPAAGALLDYWKNNTKITTTRMHKIIISSVFLCQMALFIAATFVTDFSTLILFFTIIGSLLSFNFLILQIILVSIAPNHTSEVSGFLTFWFSTATILSRTAIHSMTVYHSQNEWNNTFILTAGVLLISTVIFILYGSSEAQPWSLLPSCNPEEGHDKKYQIQELIEKRLSKVYTSSNHSSKEIEGNSTIKQIV